MKLLEGKTAIITGTNRGIGRAMLEVFAQNGANILAHARGATDEFEAFCRDIGEKYGVEIRPLYFDMTNYEAMKAAAKEIMVSKTPIDALINNAGIVYNALFQMSSLDEVRKQMEVNFFAPFVFTQLIVKLMLRRKSGSIVNIASSAAFDGNEGKSAYGASKAAIVAMTKSIARELGAEGIRANCIAPGVTETNMIFSMSELIANSIKDQSDLRAHAKPTDIAKCAAFLASDRASYITGATIRVDGGL
ncbi:MAG: SDR family oxidoreductase [Helicobacteraceae bacterium]|jgi:3-oxoacyl-[acyl-carrier protein] reductase|nr:SDR family oxidoreductase [Helicobacteraceae bacterium]